MDDLKNYIVESIKTLECFDDSETIVDYIYGVVTDDSNSESEKREYLKEFLVSLTTKDTDEFLDDLMNKYNGAEKEKQETEQKLRDAIRLQTDLKIKSVTEEELQEEYVNPYYSMSRDEKKNRDYLLSKYAYEEEDVDENGDILLSDHVGKKKEEEQRIKQSLSENNNTKRLVEEDKAKREKAKYDHAKKVERDKEALAKQKRDEEKKKTTKKEKRRL
ncbi:hypothetical protein SAMD00019534_092070 [Acytostelium subglobosum LB1]|uniref:hypothetical protein n=1 Tax=Acytostelium subglobosum LB1 TaxID=1410327 RepID=UPI000644FBA4|nr:hypothetical protein SAMD00019534_092070 [Acytostelium subglobosum LB1]GAM26032.1 hypothetical protein SAMD00019534_092070 [Acytostelium subglobosum LB1]|eukprot:XP_012751075.1 hypothetical protein SAMD00019534_092070 [Acytostelium subglobosum LB1]